MIKLNGQPYTIDTPFIDNDGTQYPANWYRLATPEERTSKGFTEEADPTVPDERYYYINTDGSVTQKPLDFCKDYAKRMLADVRWSYESKGIVYNGAIYATDTQSRINYIGALLQAQANPAFTVLWKAVLNDSNHTPTFVELNATDVLTIVSNGMAYISQCFIREDALRLEIDRSC